jgi:hypothetical protein
MADQHGEIRRAHLASQICGVVAVASAVALVILLALYVDPRGCKSSEQVMIANSILLAGCPR